MTDKRVRRFSDITNLEELERSMDREYDNSGSDLMEGDIDNIEDIESSLSEAEKKRLSEENLISKYRMLPKEKHPIY